MSVIHIEEAQARLTELIDRLAPGEEVIITRDKRPVARLQSLGAATPQPRFGSCQGKLTVLAEDDEHLKDFGEYMP